MSIRAHADAIRSQQLSVVDFCHNLFGQAETLGQRLGCFVALDARDFASQADHLAKGLAAGGEGGALAGVPVVVKDIIAAQPLSTTCGSRMLEGWRAPYEATIVKRLRNAGAILLGKSNMDEFAMGSSTENSAFYFCRNPWNLDCVPGGSSGGSAAAVAAGLCMAALGTDTGGSIRQPAALCGVVGLKPTYGRVSRYGLVAFASSLDQAGPFGKTVEDVAQVLQVIAGHDPLDSTSVDLPVGDYVGACDRDMAGLRIGVPQEYFGGGLDREVAAALSTATSELEKLGATLVDVSLPHSKYAIATYYLVCTSEASSNLARYDGVRYGMRRGSAGGLRQMYDDTRGLGFGEEVKLRIMLGTFALSSGYYDAYYGKAQRVRTLIREDFTKAFTQCDALIGPTSPFPAFPLGAKLADPLQMYLADIYTISCSLAGLPGMSVPCGFSSKGLPIGLQLIGPAFAEETLFRIGASYQRSTDWQRRRPPVASGAGA